MTAAIKRELVTKVDQAVGPEEVDLTNETLSRGNSPITSEDEMEREAQRNRPPEPPANQVSPESPDPDNSQLPDLQPSRSSPRAMSTDEEASQPDPGVRGPFRDCPRHSQHRQPEKPVYTEQSATDDAIQQTYPDTIFTKENFEQFRRTFEVACEASHADESKKRQVLLARLRAQAELAVIHVPDYWTTTRILDHYQSMIESYSTDKQVGFCTPSTSTASVSETPKASFRPIAPCPSTTARTVIQHAPVVTTATAKGEQRRLNYNARSSEYDFLLSLLCFDCARYVQGNDQDFTVISALQLVRNYIRTHGQGSHWRKTDGKASKLSDSQRNTFDHLLWQMSQNVARPRTSSLGSDTTSSGDSGHADNSVISSRNRTLNIVGLEPLLDKLNRIAQQLSDATPTASNRELEYRKYQAQVQQTNTLEALLKRLDSLELAMKPIPQPTFTTFLNTGPVKPAVQDIPTPTTAATSFTVRAQRQRQIQAQRRRYGLNGIEQVSPSNSLLAAQLQRPVTRKRSFDEARTLDYGNHTLATSASAASHVATRHYTIAPCTYTSL